MSSSSLSLPSMGSFTTVCRSNSGIGEDLPRQEDVTDGSRRRFYGNINMQLNSTRMLTGPGHIASQIREPSRAAEFGEGASGSTPSSTQALQQHEADMSSLCTPTTNLRPPCTLRRRGSFARLPFRPTDTRRHGIVLDSDLDFGLEDEDEEDEEDEEEEEEEEEEEDLPLYATIPTTPFRRMSTNAPLSAIDSRTLRSTEARQRELRELQRQWTVRRRTYPPSSRELSRPEPTRYRPLVSEAFDLPPPYARRDPYPLYADAQPRRASRAAKALLYPFVPRGKMLERAALRTDRWAEKVKGGVREGVRVVGDRAKAVPKRIEARRVLGKMRSIEERGRGRGRGETCGVRAHVCDVGVDVM